VLFPQVEQPRVFKGNLATIGIAAGIVVFALLTLFLQTRDEKIAHATKKNLMGDNDSKDSVSKSAGSIDAVIGNTLEREDTIGPKLKNPVPLV
jgi:hypothetical protein